MNLLSALLTFPGPVLPNLHPGFEKYTESSLGVPVEGQAAPVLLQSCCLPVIFVITTVCTLDF